MDKDLDLAFKYSFEYAYDHLHAYVTPEHILFILLKNKKIKRILNDSGIKIKELEDNLINYLNTYVEKKQSFPELSLDSDSSDDGLKKPYIFYTSLIDPTDSLSTIVHQSFLNSYATGHYSTGIGVFLDVLFENNTTFIHEIKSIINYENLNLRKAISLHKHDSIKNKHPLTLKEKNDSIQKENATQEESVDEKEDLHIKSKEDFLKKISINYDEFDDEFDDEEDEEDEDEFLSKYITNLSEKAKEGSLDPLIGREEEMTRVLQSLCRRLKNNPLLIGEAGVGKTAIAEGLAQIIHLGAIPKKLEGFEVLSLNLGSLVAGTRYRGDFEERVQKIFKHINSKNIILLIDEIHTIKQAGSTDEGSLDFSNMLKPLLSKGNFRILGTTTHEDIKKTLEKDKALMRRFQKIIINEPSRDESIQIMQGLKSKYEEFHKVSYTDEAINGAVDLSILYLKDKFLPDKAIDILDEAGSFRQIELYKNKDKDSIIDLKDIEHMLSIIARIPEKQVKSSEKEKLQALEETLKSKIYGQEEAIFGLSQSIKRSRAGFKHKEKPIGSFLFVGPTGVGKTELVKQLALYFGLELLRFDMGEYQEKHTVARLIGAPAGYVGYEDGGLLTDSVRKHPHSIILFDEIEKAHRDVYNILLPLLDYGTVTDSKGNKVDFRHCIIVLSSNAGASDLRKGMGFGKDSYDATAIEGALERTFTPEFRNRLDKIIYFKSLDLIHIEKVVKKELIVIKEQLEEHKTTLTYDDVVLSFIAKESYDEEFGARPIARYMDENIRNALIDDILFGSLEQGGSVHITIENGALAIKRSFNG